MEENMYYYFVNKNNEDVICLNLMEDTIFELKINEKNNLTEVHIKNKQFTIFPLNLFLLRYSKKDFSPATTIELKEKFSKIYEFFNNLYFNFHNIENARITINISKTINKLFFDENSFPQNKELILLSLYEDSFNYNNYKEFIKIFPTIKKSEIQIKLYLFTETQFYFDKIFREIIENKNFEKAFYIYTLLELYDRGSDIYLLKEGIFTQKISNDFKSLVENRISKQQLKDICENFESLQKHSIEF
jgi:hypothetical protein